MQNTNHPAYDSAMETSRLLGGDFKRVRNRKRGLVVDLVAASVVEGFALAEAIKAVKSKMGWLKLASDEQNQMNVLFTAVRLIDGAWKALPEETQKAFLAGELVYSTLAKNIKAAEKAALDAEAKAEADAEAATGNREVPVGEDGHPVQPEAESPSILGVVQNLTQTLGGELDMTPELALALMELRAKIEELAKVPAEDQAQAA